MFISTQLYLINNKNLDAYVYLVLCPAVSINKNQAVSRNLGHFYICNLKSKLYHNKKNIFFGIFSFNPRVLCNISKYYSPAGYFPPGHGSL